MKTSFETQWAIVRFLWPTLDNPDGHFYRQRLFALGVWDGHTNDDDIFFWIDPRDFVVGYSTDDWEIVHVGNDDPWLTDLLARRAAERNAN